MPLRLSANYPEPQLSDTSSLRIHIPSPYLSLLRSPDAPSSYLLIRRLQELSPISALFHISLWIPLASVTLHSDPAQKNDLKPSSPSAERKPQLVVTVRSVWPPVALLP
ncbi:hypothetical protein M5K25_018601 [Dendrobium thyrsiflorum]|uniref:Uncharacterized protein n=1 Tax=Dendrobium thyrsiflorum TaxID=117978 RepID=A0ABD0UIG3_DENTH